MDGHESASASNEKRSSLATIVVLVVISALVLPFLPLLLSGLEEVILDSTHVENFCKRMGVHDELSALYGPLLRLFK